MSSRRIDPTAPARTQPTLYDVGRLSGVSSATVSRVFSGSEHVSVEIRQRVLDAAQRLAYEPSHPARALAGRKVRTIGTLFPEIASGFYADVLAGVDEMAAERGFEVLAAFVGGRRSRSELVQRLLRQGRVDALVLLNLDADADRDAALFAGLPIVLVDRGILGTSLPVIGMDNAGGAAAVIGHFFEQGHRRIGIVTGPPGNHDSDARLQGAREAMGTLGLSFAAQWVGDFTLESGASAARHCVASAAHGCMPDAVFCLNDLMAIGMLGELGRSGLRVPDDVALAGYDDIEAADHLGLTSVASPMRLMGQIAARWAINLVSEDERPASHRLPVRLVVRHSSVSKPTRSVMVGAAAGAAAAAASCAFR